MKLKGSLRKNNRKRAYQLGEDLTTVKHGKGTTSQDWSENCRIERTRDTEPMDKILHSAVQSKG